MAASKKPSVNTIDILELERGRVEFCLLGLTPTITNRLPEKAKRELFMPARKTSNNKKMGLKHDPFEEFWCSPYTLRDDSDPTYLAALNSQFKGMLCGAALDTDGVAKTQMKRSITVLGNRLPLYGKPEFLMSVVTQSGQNRAPDIRTRLIIPEWACRVVVEFSKPLFNAKSISNLMGAAGQTQGLGEWRVEKGGDYGQFKIVDPGDANFKRIMKIGRKEQIAAMMNPSYHDEETEELMVWAIEEAENRGEKLKTPADCARSRGLKMIRRAA